ncbi:DgyrCDS4033 [Dimorphilus gyrociliatus]|uniref:DgyrCDS4033 n=1 Tax=Dimorphilus gyrociliatus TaxID=2664684 RepID=A0A7I8VIB9_9ANNE|nr:DgyrCDS4033 [Dimorphilus gyrociliatus]
MSIAYKTFKHAIPEIERLSDRVIRILGLNPSLMTLAGTNTYLIGTGKRRILVDTGSKGFPKYIENLQKVLKENDTSIGKIIITHWHNDHTGGIDEIYDNILKNDDIPLLKFKMPDGKDSSLKKHSRTYQFIEDNDVFRVDGATLRALHTPGHCEDHIMLYLEEENALFSGDAVLGEGTAVFNDLFDLMESLKKALRLEPTVLYPGHGPLVTEVKEHIGAYIEHRNNREIQIVNYLMKNASDMHSAEEIMEAIYENVPSQLHFKAVENVHFHLMKLLKEKKTGINKFFTV